MHGWLLFLALVIAGIRAPQAEAQALPEGTVLVAGMGDNSVWLVDLATGERRGMIETHIAPHEIAVSSDGLRAVVTNYGDSGHGPGNIIQRIDVTTGKVTGEIVVEGFERLHGVAYLPGDSLLAVTSERTGEILILGMSDGQIRKKLTTGGRTPHMISLGGPWIWTANIRDGTVSRVDPSGVSDPRVWPAGTATEGVASTPDGAEGWTGSREGGEVVGVVGETGEVVARIGGLQLPYRLAITPDGATVVVSDPAAHTLVLIDRASGRIRGTVDIAAASSAEGLGAEPSPQGFTLSPDGQWAFVATKEIDRVAVVDLRSAEVVRFLQTGSGPDGIAFSRVRVTSR